MTAPLVFLDTETTGLSLDDDIWEFAGIRRHPDGQEIELHLFIDHDVSKCFQLPESFKADHRARYDEDNSVTRREASRLISRFLAPDAEYGKAHVVGAVPNFDTERIARMLAAYDWPTLWHHHLIDVENLAIGYLRGLGLDLASIGADLPWDSDALSALVGVDSSQFHRHAAMDDARWAMAIYDLVMGARP